MARHGMFLSEGVGGAVYLLSGAVFPLDVLPGWLQRVGLVLPTTYWLEGVRRAILGPQVGISPTLARCGDGALALMLCGSTLVLVVLALLVFRWGERRAQRLGRFDQTTGY
jgi:ABC-2 type transport system permease protein